MRRKTGSNKCSSTTGPRKTKTKTVSVKALLKRAAVMQAEEARRAYQREIAARHLGIITQRVYRWHWHLPVTAKAFYDPADMINDVAQHITIQSHKFNRNLAKESTWVYWTAEHCCQDILARHQREKRRAELIELADAPTNKLAQESFLRERQAFNAVERVIEHSSDAVQDLIEILLSGKVRRRRDLPPQARAAIEELQKRAKQQRATAEDFLTVYRYA